jgi:hypothetical protein
MKNSAMQNGKVAQKKSQKTMATTMTSEKVSAGSKPRKILILELLIQLLSKMFSSLQEIHFTSKKLFCTIFQTVREQLNANRPLMKTLNTMSLLIIRISSLLDIQLSNT